MLLLYLLYLIIVVIKTKWLLQPVSKSAPVGLEHHKIATIV